MFNKVFKNKKRAVSPVIAVVLLIALTVAAAAIIWSVSQGFFETQASLTPTTTSTAATSWTGDIASSAAGQLTGATFTDGNITAAVTWEMVDAYIDLVKGGNGITINFVKAAGSAGTALAIAPGTYTISFTFEAEGSETQTTETVSATWS